MALETVEDIIRALQEHPEWREPLLDALLSDQYRQLPSRTDRLEEALARLAEESAKTDQALRELSVSLQRSREENDRAFAELRESLQRSKEENDRSFAELRESLQRSKEENDRAFAELRESLQRSKEENDRAFAELRESLQRSREENDRAFKEMRENTQLMKEETDRVIDRLQRDTAELKGYHLEEYYRHHATAILGRYFRSLKVVDKGDYLQKLHEQSPMTDEEWRQLVSADLFLRGRHQPSGAEYLTVWEISWKIDRSDVQRAIQRAELLRRWEANTLPVVAGKNITQGARRMAQQSGVLVVQETTVINGTSPAARG